MAKYKKIPITPVFSFTDLDNYFEWELTIKIQLFKKLLEHSFIELDYVSTSSNPNRRKCVKIEMRDGKIQSLTLYKTKHFGVGLQETLIKSLVITVPYHNNDHPSQERVLCVRQKIPQRLQRLLELAK